MKLNKDICAFCYSKSFLHERWGDTDDRRLEKGTVYCPHGSDGPGVVNIEPIPISCLYVAEQVVVSEGDKNVQRKSDKS